MNTYYLSIHSSNLSELPFWFIIQADSDVSACRHALEALALQPDCFDQDDQIIVNTEALPMEGIFLGSSRYYFVWQFFPEVDPSAPRLSLVK